MLQDALRNHARETRWLLGLVRARMRGPAGAETAYNPRNATQNLARNAAKTPRPHQDARTH
eukprot:356388-Lingulodinium_polyedra.AAC.1